MTLLRQPVAQQATQTHVGAFLVEGWRKGGGRAAEAEGLKAEKGPFAHPTAPPRTDPIQPLAQVAVVGFEPAPLRTGT